MAPYPPDPRNPNSTPAADDPWWLAFWGGSLTECGALERHVANWAAVVYCAFLILFSLEAYPDSREKIFEKFTPWFALVWWALVTYAALFHSELEFWAAACSLDPTPAFWAFLAGQVIKSLAVVFAWRTLNKDLEWRDGGRWWWRGRWCHPVWKPEEQ